jgi:predicted small metal-binding protein
MKLIRCECGFVAKGADDEAVIAVIQDHLASDHPALLATVTKEDLLSWIQAE